ncbi:hypothetical protein D6T65_04995 [Arthrobacter frigidicola]|nr:hypothetical protein D6T65_04995 [Arthrobacter frigidicola]
MVAELIEFPNPAVWLIRYLDAALDVPVLGEVPATRPATFVLVENAGGALVTPVTDGGQLLVGSWDTTNPKAERLAAKVRALIRAAAGVTVQGEQCKATEELGRPVYMPDPDARVPRYRQNVVLHFRGTTL